MAATDTASAVHDALAALAESARRLAEGGDVAAALEQVARAAATGTAADAAVLRLVEDDGVMVARAVAASSRALAAELRGARTAAERDERVAALVGATATLFVPLNEGSRRLGVLELYRDGAEFGDEERLFAEVAAHQAALALRAGGRARRDGSVDRQTLLEVAGDALSASSDDDRAADRVARLAAVATDATGAVVWRAEAGEIAVAGSFGARPPEPRRLRRFAETVIGGGRTHIVTERVGERTVATLQLGEPPVGALQLLFPPSAAPSEPELARLATFAVRAAHALRSNDRARELGVELERSRALLAVVGQAIAQLSLSHTLRTAVERVAALVGAERVAVYLEEDERVVAAESEGLDGPHERVAARLLEVALGPLRGRGIVHVEDAAADERLAPAADAVAQSGIESAYALPLVVGDDVIGLLVAYPSRGRTLTANESALLTALAGQLAVAVQNARLHEHATTLAREREAALASERLAARKLGALYEISRSFAQSLSLDTTLDAVAQTVVELLDVDAAVIRMPDERGLDLVARNVHVREPRLAEVVRTVLAGPQPLASLPLRRLFRTGEPMLIGPREATALGGATALLVPFLEKGGTAALIPIATPTEVLATLTIVSLEPGRAVDRETMEAALSVAGQAALAIDNARLYQQQKDFADTMTRSLLPRSAPQLPGLDLGAVYESSATVDVGGDVYDYLTLADGRLAVVLGDVTGHGIDATADMAMAKFVFRSLAREHSEPADFLRRANSVVAGEVAAGKFITMAYVTVDAERGEIACGCGGHPAPRIVGPRGAVEAIDARGLALGIESDVEYDEVRVPFERGATIVLYTDGVIEARRRRELYGFERFEGVLAAAHRLPAKEIAEAVLADCRAWSGGELVDDCAVVVIKRT